MDESLFLKHLILQGVLTEDLLQQQKKIFSELQAETSEGQTLISKEEEGIRNRPHFENTLAMVLHELEGTTEPQAEKAKTLLDELKKISKYSRDDYFLRKGTTQTLLEEPFESKSFDYLTPVDTLATENKLVSEESEKLSSLAAENSFLERYEVIETLGEGGMGVVQLVQDHLLGREVALKKIKIKKLRTLSQKQQLMLWRLKTEASITAILEHPNIVPLYDMQKDKKGELQFTMRKVAGDTLRNLLLRMREKKEPVDENRLIAIFLKVCDAVAYAHSQGILHRDLKPDNIMVGQFGEVYVMDWGIAKKLDRNKKSIGNSPSRDKNISVIEEISYQTIGGMGTPGYMSPEQKEDARQVQEHADIYALGIILRECFTLYSPIEEWRLFLKQQNKEQKHSSKGTLSKTLLVPQDIEAIVQKATAQDPKERYASVQKLKLELERYLKNFRISAREYTLWERFQKWEKRNKEKIRVGSFIFSLILILIFYFQWSQQQETLGHFSRAFQQAKQEWKLAFKIKEQHQNQKNETQIEKRIEHLFNALNLLNYSIALIPSSQEVAQDKYLVGKELIELCCQTKDYQLANYLANELARLSVVTPKKQKEITQFVKEQKNLLLKQHRKRLTYWVGQLKNPRRVGGIRERALLEISKMKEKEIFEQLVQFTKEGTRYFLTSQERSSKQEEFYKIMVTALGWLENPKAKKVLLDSLIKVKDKVIDPFLPEKLISDIDFMVILTEALENSNASEVAKKIEQIRYETEEDSIYWMRTEEVFRRLLVSESLLKEEVVLADEFKRRGYYKYSVGDLIGAKEDYTAALRIDYQDAYVYNSRGRIHLELGELKEALEDINQAIQLKPNVIDFYLNRGTIRSSLGDIEGALKDYHTMLYLNPKESQAYVMIAHLKMTLKDFEGALANFNKAIEYDPNSIYAYDNRALLKRDLNDFKGALEDLNIARKLNPENATIYYHLATVKRLSKDFQGAIQDCSKAIELEPQHPYFYHLRGICKHQIQDFKGALIDYNEVIRLSPKTGRYYNDRALVKQAQGKEEEAIHDFVKGLTFDPSDPYYLNFFIELLLKRMIALYRKRDFENALNKALLFQKYAPKTHPKQKEIGKILQQIKTKIAKEKKQKK